MMLWATRDTSAGGPARSTASISAARESQGPRTSIRNGALSGRREHHVTIPQDAAEAEAAAQGLPRELLVRGRVNFREGAMEALIPLAIAAVLVVLAMANMAGINAGEGSVVGLAPDRLSPRWCRDGWPGLRDTPGSIGLRAIWRRAARKGRRGEGDGRGRRRVPAVVPCGCRRALPTHHLRFGRRHRLADAPELVVALLTRETLRLPPVG